MNRENLQRMADYIRTIPQAMFSMRSYRFADETTKECGSIGCVIGHCTVLDTNPLPTKPNGSINFNKWSDCFTETNTEQWLWCFGASWCSSDNTPDGAADRIEWLLKNGLPDDWEEQLMGKFPLCYKGGEQ
jgi:hypothetical protein